MRMKLFILLALLSLAAAKDLTAEVRGVPTFSGCNCKSDNNPNPLEVGIAIQNPSSRTLRLSYELYDPSTDSYKQGNMVACSGGSNTILPSSYDSCRLYLYSMMGGLNGSSKAKFRLIGQDGLDEYTRTFEVLINYHTSPYEENVVSRLSGVEYSFQQLNAELQNCFGDTCCGMVRAHMLMLTALSNLSEANSSLRACRLSSAWDYVMNASNSVRSANESFMLLKGNCSSALSLINTTGLRIASVTDVVLEGKKCGANVTLSQSYLADANNSLEEAKQLVGFDDYLLAFSKLENANNSIFYAVSSIGQCARSKPEEPVVPPAKQNTTNQSSEEPPPDNTLPILIGGVVVVVVIIVLVAAAVLLLTKRGRSKPSTQAPPPAPPATPPQTPPAPPEIHEDLEKEFNEWLESHSQKK